MNKALAQNWILLRGLARESAHWGAFVPLLQATFPDAQVTLLDLPGTGCFHRETSPGTIKAITDRVRRHALANGFIQQPATILALSLGAMVAWEWMRSYPEDICGATLMNTSFADLSPFYQRLRWQSYGKFAALAMTRDLHNWESEILQLVSNRRYIARDGVYAASQSGTGAAQDEQITQAWAEIQNERPISLENRFRQIIAAATYRPGDIKPKPPVLLLNGQGDRLVAPVCSEAIHKKWNLELRSHPWAGHDLTLDDGAWVALQLKDWVTQKSFIHHEDTKDTKFISSCLRGDNLLN
jgi:pimeloyl-ACP methyl ester carboxylesterase